MRDVTVTLLERLHTHRHLVAEAYHQGSIVRSDDNRKASEVLQQQRVLVPHTPEEYRLHSTLRRFLDSALNTHRILHSSADIGTIFVSGNRAAFLPTSSAGGDRIEADWPRSVASTALG